MVRLFFATIYIEQSATHKSPADWKPLFASWLPYCASQACQYDPVTEAGAFLYSLM